MLSKKKKIIILCGMLVLLVVTGVLNIVLNQSSIATGSGDAMQSASFSRLIEAIELRPESKPYCISMQ